MCLEMNEMSAWMSAIEVNAAAAEAETEGMMLATLALHFPRYYEGQST